MSDKLKLARCQHRIDVGILTQTEAGDFNGVHDRNRMLLRQTYRMNTDGLFGTTGLAHEYFTGRHRFFVRVSNPIFRSQFGFGFVIAAGQERFCPSANST